MENSRSNWPKKRGARHLLTNAVHSIEVGVEDFRSTDPRRLASAVRNVQAGILLLCKEKLRQLSPPTSDEVLIKQRIVSEIDAAGQLVFKGQGDKTVDEHQIIERFTQLGIHLDWTPPPLFNCSDCGELAVVVDEGTCASCGRGGYELRCDACNEPLTDEDRGQSDTRCLLHLDAEFALFAVDRRRGWDPQ